MCDFSGKLIAWLDHELSEKEASEVHFHVKECAECRNFVHIYKEADKRFDAYCEAVMASKADPKQPRWTPALVAGISAAAAALLFIFVARPMKQTPIGQIPTRSQAIVASPTSVAQIGVTVQTNQQQHIAFQKHHPARPVKQRPPRNFEQNADTNWTTTGQSVQIAIPADAVFPPGAVPEGVNFIADLSIAADGSPEQLHLRP